MKTNLMESKICLKQTELEYLMSSRAVRDMSQQMLELSLRGGTHFKFQSEKLGECVDFVLEVIRENYPDLKVPFHSRWRHFEVGGAERLAKFFQELQSLNVIDRLKAEIDLVVTSVLLDAGAGNDWMYLETSSGKKFSRSEGLGVASFHWFCEGGFSSSSSGSSQFDRSPALRFRADAARLQGLELAELDVAFQTSSENPLAGREGRWNLLRALGRAVEDKRYFTEARPSGFVEPLLARAQAEWRGRIPAPEILKVILFGLGPIWPGRIKAELKEGAVGSEFNLGDVWASQAVAGLVPLHKLSQWLSYSMIESFERAGVPVSDLKEMTGLAEYRNGGLLIDVGLLEPRDPEIIQRPLPPGHDAVVEWRSLTVALLDLMGAELRKKLGRTEAEFPLVKALEGGTWWAGRKIAAQKRKGGGPPIQILSDGTVF